MVNCFETVSTLYLPPSERRKTFEDGPGFTATEPGGAPAGITGNESLKADMQETAQGMTAPVSAESTATGRHSEIV